MRTAPANSLETSKPASAKPGVKRRWLLAILALAFLFVLMPFLFWEATWFGRPLDDAQLQKSLADRQDPREIQHALSQIADRILAPDPARRNSARRFYPDVIRVAQTSGDELRITAAWVMGQDNSSPEFHRELLALLGDPNPMVRRNAALALVRFHDESGRDEIHAILQPYSTPAPRPGKLIERLKPPETINPGALLGWIETDGKKMEVRSRVPGTIDHWLVADGAQVSSGQPILSIDPSSAEVWEALRALYLIGQDNDLPAVEQFARGVNGMPPNIRQQATFTAQAIRSRQ
jgi:biotin carboxyl carrier protein